MIKFCCIGSVRSTPTLALNALINLLPPDIAVKRTATIMALRLKESGIRGRSSNLPLPEALNDIPDITDYCVLMVNLQKPFRTFLPSREDWNGGSNWNMAHLNFFTDGFRLDDRVVGGVFCPELDLKISFKLPDHCSVFQAEIAAIGKD